MTADQKPTVIAAQQAKKNKRLINGLIPNKLPTGSINALGADGNVPVPVTTLLRLHQGIAAVIGKVERSLQAADPVVSPITVFDNVGHGHVSPI